jgi:predicted  nucleic acid-binding Zn-ribbon protein
VSALKVLKALVELQKIDAEILKMEKNRQHIPARLKEIDDTLEGMRRSLQQELEQLDEAEMARRMAESDLRAEKEQIKKWEARLNEVHNNRDYQALSREIESARKANLALEDEILRKMQEIEELKVSTEKKKAQLEETEKKLLAEKAELEKELVRIDAEISQQQQVRQQAAERVEKRYLQQYQLISSRRDGIAVVPVLDEHCLGCHMGIPPQLYNLVLRGDEVRTCPHCMRIIYYEEAMKNLDLD